MSSLGHMPDGPWTFDTTVTDCFEDMLERSIPQYETMRSLVTFLGSRFLPDDGVCLDLGCSRGEAIDQMFNHKPHATYYGYDSSQPMIEAARQRFALVDNVSFEHSDIRKRHYAPADLALLVLTLQFIPIHDRLPILMRIRDAVPALILVEKVKAHTPQCDDLLIEVYHEKKRRSGYSDEEIERKAMSLDGVLVRETASRNETMLVAAGFRQVECFWRWANFAGWIALQ